MRTAVTFLLFAYPYYLVMLAQKKSNQKTLVQKKAIAVQRSLSCQNAYSIALVIIRLN
jgi:hypothetical protein